MINTAHLHFLADGRSIRAIRLIFLFFLFILDSFSRRLDRNSCNLLLSFRIDLYIK